MIDSYVLALGTDQKVYIIRMSGCDPGNIVCAYNYSPWQLTGQSTFVSQPAAGYIGSGRLQAFALGADRSIYSNIMYEPRNIWSWWYPWTSNW